MERFRLFFSIFLLTNKIYSQVVFEDVTELSGIDHIYEVYQGLFGGGVAVFDFNNDGFEDLFITGGNSQDKLYQNNGNGQFLDVASGAGIYRKDNVITTGVSTADVNKDGFTDILVTTFASDQINGIITIDDGKTKGVTQNILYINNTDGTFTDNTENYKLIKKNFSTSASFGDINADGFPDLFIANYFKDFKGNLGNLSHYSINEDYEPEFDELYLNIEGKYFKNISSILSDSAQGYGFGAVFTDVDNDNDLDLYVVNDFGETNQPNQLFINQYPKLGFINKSEEMKVSFGMKAMGIGIGDYNNDGYQDYHVTNIFAGPFMVNRGENKPFLNLSSNIGTGLNSISAVDTFGKPTTVVGWGSLVLDYDNDTDLDLFNTNGSINPPVELIPNTLFKNMGRVFELDQQSGVMDYGIGRGAVSFYYDNDGDLDLFVVNQRPVYDMSNRGGVVKSKLYKNNSNNNNNWLKVKLKGKQSTIRGLGAMIKLFLPELQMIREVDGGSSHASQNSSIVHFGLGLNQKIDSVTVTWPGGKAQSLINPKINSLIKIEESPNLETSIFQTIMNYFKY